MGFIESCESGSMSGTAPRHHAPCEDGKETHGHSRSQPAERSGRHSGRRKGGREEGRGLLPSRGPTRSTPGSRKQAGGSPARMQRSARSEALRGQPRCSTEGREQRASG